MNKHSVSMVIIPPTVIALIGATSIGIFIASSAAAMGVHAWWIEGFRGFGVALSVVFGFGFLFWLNFLYPQEKPVIVKEQVINPRPYLVPEPANERVLLRDPLESISQDKAYQVAYRVLNFNANVTFNALADILSPAEISSLQTELKRRNMAIPKRSDDQGGIELTDKGVRGLKRYLSPTESYEEWKNAIPA